MSLIHCKKCGFGGETSRTVSEKEEKVTCPSCGHVLKWVIFQGVVF
ncbi:hypothetical protein [Methanosarcina barkeri]|nr:hypothetical protein [Methanosarcina barkeri]